MNNLIKLQENQLESTNDVVTSPFGEPRRQYHNGEFWMCAQDAFKILGYKDVGHHSSTIVKRLLEEADYTKFVDRSSGQGRYMTYINCHGFIKLCLSSTLDNAKDIQDWFINSFFNNQKQLLISSSDAKLLATNHEFLSMLLPEIVNCARKVGYADMAELLECKDLFSIGDLGKLLKIEGLGPGNMYKYFLAKKFTFKKPHDDGTYPNQYYVKKEWMVLKLSTYRKENGDVCKTAVTKLTSKGLLGFAYKILSEEGDSKCNSRLPILSMK